MRRTWPVRLTWSAVALAVLASAALDVALAVDFDDRLAVAFAALALVGLVVSQRWPYAGFAATLPALVTSYALIATLVALFEAARRTRDRRILLCAAVITAVGYVVKLPVDASYLTLDRALLLEVVYAVLMGGAPVALGQLLRARTELREQLREIEAAHQVEQELLAEQVLSEERTQLAREMHDVVSHQVSLIAVQAGVLTVRALDTDTAKIASTIRALSVRTLDELRHMVALLRLSRTAEAQLAPQPTLSQLPALVAGSGIDAVLEGELDLDLDPPTQRACYRTVQEALTNVRKHAPGASAVVRVARLGNAVEVSVVNGPPTRPSLELPSARHGLIGLRERADLLGGSLTAQPLPDGGFILTLRAPIATG
jgi:signal transduction histidine kinase